MRSTLRILATILATMALLVASACSSSSSKDEDTVDSSPGGGGETPDAAGGGGTPDAAGGGGTPDAGGGGGGGALLGLGQLCPTGAECTTGAATQCVSLQTTQFCTLPCGTTDTTDAPPEGGDAACASAFQGTTPTDGTPACFLYASTTAPIDWSCGILCGTYQTTDFGGCPDGLSCSNNACM